MQRCGSAQSVQKAQKESWTAPDVSREARIVSNSRRLETAGVTCTEATVMESLIVAAAHTHHREIEYTKRGLVLPPRKLRILWSRSPNTVAGHCRRPHSQLNTDNILQHQNVNELRKLITLPSVKPEMRGRNAESERHGWIRGISKPWPRKQTFSEELLAVHLPKKVQTWLALTRKRLCQALLKITD